MQVLNIVKIFMRTWGDSKESWYNRINNFGIHILNLLIGFFTATTLSTIPGQTDDWAIVASALLTSICEFIGYIRYHKNQIRQKTPSKYLVDPLNTMKIGLTYGLFVDAFKLGS